MLSQKRFGRATRAPGSVAVPQQAARRMAPVQHASPLARGAIEVVPDRLYWVTCGVAPDETEDSHYFAIDNKFVYQPFAHDFGPLNLGMICRYCKLLQEKLSDPSLRDKRIIHYCSRRSFKKANAVLLICSYQVLALGRSAAKAFEPFQELSQELLPFRDASRGPSTFPLMILDCLEALQMGIEKRWLDWNKFNADSYDYFSQVDVGDMNWIIPRKFLAFASPSPTPTDAEGFPAVMPEAYAKTFLEAGIRLVVRLNDPCYDAKRFVNSGVDHVDLFFKDGTCPPRDIISKFLDLVESEQGGVAVHCKAGLGRTGTLIGLYAMKHHFVPAKSFIAWCRICRPGSVLGPQQQFLINMEAEMFQAGVAMRGTLPALAAPPRSAATEGGTEAGLRAEEEEEDETAKGSLERKMGRLSVHGAGEQCGEEDVGQGDRPCGAKRNSQHGKSVAGPSTPRGNGPWPPQGGSPLSSSGRWSDSGNTGTTNSPTSSKASSRASTESVWSCMHLD